MAHSFFEFYSWSVVLGVKVILSFLVPFYEMKMEHMGVKALKYYLGVGLNHDYILDGEPEVFIAVY